MDQNVCQGGPEGGSGWTSIVKVGQGEPISINSADGQGRRGRTGFSGSPQVDKRGRLLHSSGRDGWWLGWL